MPIVNDIAIALTVAMAIGINLADATAFVIVHLYQEELSGYTSQYIYPSSRHNTETLQYSTVQYSTVEAR